MSFGGGSGFSPSRTIVEASTKTGNDAGQTHQFTGSVNIAGNLNLNGAPVAGGGGTPAGATTQIQYNNAGAFGAAAELTYDGSIFGLGNPVANRQMTIHGGLSLHTGSMIVDDGPLIVQSDPSSEWFSVGQRSPGWIVNNSGGGITLIASANDMGAKLNVSSTNTSVPPMAIGKYPASTANTLEVNSTNTDEGGDFFVIDSDGNTGIGVLAPTQKLDVAGTANATALSVGGVAITSTPAELNLLDASTVTAPSEGIWTGVERVAVINIGASEYTAAAHVLGVTLPDKAILTKATLDVFQGLVGGTTTISLTTTGNVHGPVPAPIDFLAGFGGGAIPIAGFAVEQGVPLSLQGGKLNGASTLTFTVAGDPLTAGGINVYVHYIMGT